MQSDAILEEAMLEALQRKRRALEAELERQMTEEEARMRAQLVIDKREAAKMRQQAMMQKMLAGKSAPVPPRLAAPRPAAPQAAPRPAAPQAALRPAAPQAAPRPAAPQAPPSVLSSELLSKISTIHMEDGESME